MLIKAKNTLDAFSKAKSFLKSISNSIDPEILKESPILFVFNNLEKDLTIPIFNGKEFLKKYKYPSPIEKIALSEFKHYSNLLSNEVKIIVSYLRINPSSKRAIIDVWKKEQKNLKNKAECLIYISFRKTREGLDMHVHMRANDAKSKSLLNFHVFSSIHRYISEQLNWKIGNYYHYSDSYHIYR